jgi:hypothetical protein
LEDNGIITLTLDDIRIGQLKWLEILRLRDLTTAAEVDFGRWADAMAGLYGVGPGYIIGDPALGFVPKPEETTHD